MWFAITMPLVLAFVPKMESRTAGDEAGEDTPGEDTPGEDTPPRAAASTGLTPAQGFRSPTFYLLFFASLVSAVTGVALVLNLVPVLTFTGLTRIDAVAVAGTMGVSSIVGRIFGGWLMDQYDVRKLAVGASIISLGMPACLLGAPGLLWSAMLGVVAYGLTAGMKMNAVVYLVSTHLGLRSFGLFYGTISITTTVAMGIGPLIANYIYDVTLSYTPVIWAAVPGFLLSALLFAMLGPAPDFAGREGGGAGRPSD
jgi:predicted MFS family arabinose efflux permease